MPYTYSTRVRVTPPAGAATVYDLSTWTYVTRQTMRDSPIFSEQEMLDFTVEQTRYGSRRQVFLDFEFTDSTAQESSLIAILTAALDDAWTIEVSLNGGTTYREAVLSSYEVGDIEDKKNCGRMYATVWTVKTLQAAPVAVLGGAW